MPFVARNGKMGIYWTRFGKICCKSMAACLNSRFSWVAFWATQNPSICKPLHMYTHIAHTELKKKPNNQMQKTNQKQNGVQKTRAHVKRDGVKDERFQPKTNYYNGTIHNFSICFISAYEKNKMGGIFECYPTANTIHQYSLICLHQPLYSFIYLFIVNVCVCAHFFIVVYSNFRVAREYLGSFIDIRNATMRWKTMVNFPYVCK